MGMRFLGITCLVLLVGCSGEAIDNEMTQPETNFHYNRDFALRFSLPAEAASDLAPGLQAVRTTIRKPEGVPYCFWQLYLDERLMVKMPAAERQALSFELLGEDGFFSFLTDGERIDRQIAGEMDEFNYRLLVWSPSGFTTATIERYRRRLVDGTGAISFFSACDLVAEDPVTLYLRLQTVGESSDIDRLIHDETKRSAASLGFLKLPLPPRAVPSTDGLWNE